MVVLLYVRRRLLQGAVAVVGVTLIIFFATRLSGDVALLLAPDNASVEEVEAIRARHGLDRPLPVQYLVFVGNAAQGDFGRSSQSNLPAMNLVFERLPATFQLAATGFLFAILLGIPVGLLAATRRGGLLDKSLSAVSLLGQAMPNFWLAIMLILIFSVSLGWLPSAGRGSLWHFVLPTIALGWFFMAAIMRVTRASMVEVLDNEYMKLARLTGNPERRVYWKHGLRNALIPVVTLAGLHLGALLGGTVIIETVFGWPGLGSLVLNAVYARDYPVVQAGVFVIAIFYVLVSLTVDLLYGVIDPRIRYR